METQTLTYVITDETDRTITVVPQHKTDEPPLTDEQIIGCEANGWTIIRDAHDRYRHTLSLIGYSTDESKVYQNYLMHALMATATTEQMTTANQIARRMVALYTAAA